MTPPDIDGLAGGGGLLPDARLRELADGALRRAALAVVPFDEADLAVREMMQHACDVARERGLRAEQLLVFLKQVWRELPEGRRLAPADADAALSRAITICIREYFAPAGKRS